MHTALCKLAYSGLAGRRRDTRMMLCVLAAAFALMTAMLCYAASGTRAQDAMRATTSRPSSSCRAQRPPLWAKRSSTPALSTRRGWRLVRWARRMSAILRAAG